VLLLTCNKCPCGSYQPKEKEESGSGWSWAVIGDDSGSDGDGWSWGENEDEGIIPQIEAKVLGTFVVNGADEGMAEADLTDYHGPVMGAASGGFRLADFVGWIGRGLRSTRSGITVGCTDADTVSAGLAIA
jgi:hypothetical protein